MAKNSSASCVANYSQLSVCQGDMEPFKADLSTCGRLRSLETSHSKSSLGNFQHQYLPELLVNMYSHHFDGEKCVLLLCAWKVAFLKSCHNYR